MLTDYNLCSLRAAAITTKPQLPTYFASTFDIVLSCGLECLLKTCNKPVLAAVAHQRHSRCRQVEESDVHPEDNLFVGH